VDRAAPATETAQLSLEQLFPERRTLEPSEAYGDLGLAELAPPDRPYVVANMICSVDGRATLEGATERLTSEIDRRIMGELRGQVDAVMVGTRTLAIERYRPLARTPERRERRRRLGLKPVPLAVTATRTMELPVESPLFQDPGSRVVVLTNSDRDPPHSPATITIERVPAPELDLAVAVGRLREAHGVRSLLLEGGPTLLAAMAHTGVVDELFLTVAPKLVGGGRGPTILEAALAGGPVDVSLRSAMREGGYLFLRYALAPPG
jgi:riboflavin-specific deaminase-like protein